MSTILLVSADGELRRLAAAELAKGGHHSLLSSDPIEAARLLAAGGVDGAIVDLELPEPGGEALVARIRAENSGRDLPVLAVLRRGADAGRCPGADRWLARPLGRAAVGEAVLALVSAGRGSRPPLADAGPAAAGTPVDLRSVETAQLCRALRGPLSVVAGHLEAVRARHRDLPDDIGRRLQEMAQAAAKIAVLIDGAREGEGRGRG